MNNEQLAMSNEQIHMTQIFGDFSEDLPDGQEGLTLVFSPTSLPLKQRWRNNGLSADFMADYFATFSPGGEEATSDTDTESEIKGAVSFIANELLENAMKFNDETSPYPVSLRLQMDRHRLVFLVTNSVTSKTAQKFQAFIKELINSDPSEFYVRLLEANAEDSSESDSGLGLVTMINDYHAKLGWKFETVQEISEAIAVTTMVQLTL